MNFNTPFRVSYWLAFLPFIAICFISARSVSLQEKYIDEYKEVAISEMLRTGIPASIKMAQALIESQSGRSELALQANNHFGIKCKNDWNGNIYYYQDDDRNAQGEIIHSCFRSYTSAIESYKDHSEFLTGRSRYKELFSLSKNDYISWAQGLKRCGYATDPNYSERLIRIIEKYNLNLLDTHYNIPVVEETKATDSIPELRIDKPVDPIISKQQKVITTAKNIPLSFVKLNHKSFQKQKRKKRF